MRSASVSSTAAILRSRWRRRNVLFAFQLPYDQITKSNKERNQSERPSAAFPVVHRRDPYHQTEANHGPYDPSPDIRAPAHTSHLRCKQFCRNRLTLLHHHADRPLPHAVSYKREDAYHDHNQHGRTEDGQKHDRHDWDRNEITHLFKIGIFIFVIRVNHDSMLAPKRFLQLPVNSVGEIG